MPQDGPKTHLFVCSLVAHDSDCFDGKKDGECLADLVVQVCSANFLDVDVVGLLQ